MIDKGSAGARTRERTRGGASTVSRWILPAILAFVFVTGVIAVNAASPYIFKGATLEGDVAAQLQAITGLDFSAKVSGRFDLLPRPHLVFYKVRVADRAGALTLDCEEFDGDVRLLPLIVGRIELSSATLIEPKVALDLDATPIGRESFIGRAIRSGDPAQGERTLGTVTLVNGSAAIRSKALRPLPALEAVNVTLDWRDLDSPATLTGSLSIRKVTAVVAAWVAQPTRLMRGDHSAVALDIHSAPVDLSANGDLVKASTTAFRGHLAAKSPAGATLLDLIGVDATLLAPFANLSLNSDASLSIDPDVHAAIDLPNLTLRADGNEFEGTLAFQSGARPSLSGTLASEQLMLAPFLVRLPPLRGPVHGWSEIPILGRRPRMIDLDLRVSATHVRLSPITIDDAALAIMTRADRTEVALVEGKAYGGDAKGRVSVGVSREGISLRGSGSISGADASAMTWDLFGRQVAAGTMAGSFTLETAGDSPAALMRNLQGWAKGSGADGDISGADLARALHDLERSDLAALANALHSGRTPFRSLSFGARIADGVATLDEAVVKSAGADLTVSGTADFGRRRLDLDATATAMPAPSKATDTTKTSASTPRLAFSIRGSFSKVSVEPALHGSPASPSSNP